MKEGRREKNEGRNAIGHTVPSKMKHKLLMSVDLQTTSSGGADKTKRRVKEWKMKIIMTRTRYQTEAMVKRERRKRG